MGLSSTGLQTNVSKILFSVHDPTAGRVPFSALLLAGGESTRMGRDKAMIDAGGIPLWQRQVEILKALKPSQLFISSALRARLRDATLQPVDDLTPGAGPLAGVAAGLRHCATPLLVVLAVDMPRMNTGLLQQLLERAGGDRGVVPRVGNRLEPLAAVYARRSLSSAEHCLEKGVLKMQTFAELAIQSGTMDVYSVPSGQEALFFNLNTPEDVVAFENAALQ